MALINTIIPPQNYEKIRDSLFDILVEEISNQFILLSDPEFNARVFKERVVPFDSSELPCINILFVRGEYDNIDVIQTRGEYTYFIDVYTKAKTTNAKRGDTTSLEKLQRILGIVRTILEDPQYRTLTFTAPSLEHTEVKSISIIQPENNQDSNNISLGRLTFIAVITEGVELLSANIITEAETNVEINDTDKGHVLTKFTP